MLSANGGKVSARRPPIYASFRVRMCTTRFPLINNLVKQQTMILARWLIIRLGSSHGGSTRACNSLSLVLLRSCTESSRGAGVLAQSGNFQGDHQLPAAAPCSHCCGVPPAGAENTFATSRNSVTSQFSTDLVLSQSVTNIRYGTGLECQLRHMQTALPHQYFMIAVSSIGLETTSAEPQLAGWAAGACVWPRESGCRTGPRCAQDNNVIALGLDDAVVAIYNVRLDTVQHAMRCHSGPISGGAQP